MSDGLQEKSGFNVWWVVIPELFNWWSNLDRTESLSKSSFVVPSGNVVSVDDHVSFVVLGNNIFYKKLFYLSFVDHKL